MQALALHATPAVAGELLKCPYQAIMFLSAANLGPCHEALLTRAVQVGQCGCVRAAGLEHAVREERARSGAGASTSGRPALHGRAKVSGRARRAAAPAAARLRAETETVESPKGVLVGASEPAACASEFGSPQGREQQSGGAPSTRASASERASSGGAARLAAGSGAPQEAQAAAAWLEDSPGATGGAAGGSLRRPMAPAPADAVRCLPQGFHQVNRGGCCNGPRELLGSVHAAHAGRSIRLCCVCAVEHLHGQRVSCASRSSHPSVHQRPAWRSSRLPEASQFASTFHASTMGLPCAGAGAAQRAGP